MPTTSGLRVNALKVADGLAGMGGVLVEVFDGSVDRVRGATPRVATPCVATPRIASPHVVTPLLEMLQ